MGKNWFDQVKIQLLSHRFWMPLFEAVEQVCLIASNANVFGASKIYIVLNVFCLLIRF